MAFEPGIMVSTRVRSDRVADFERWVLDIVEASASSPSVLPPLRWFRRWDVRAPTEEGVEYIVLGAGSDLSSFDLEPVLVGIYGAERAQDELDRFVSMLVDEQDAWTLVPLRATED